MAKKTNVATASNDSNRNSLSDVKTSQSGIWSATPIQTNGERVYARSSKPRTSATFVCVRCTYAPPRTAVAAGITGTSSLACKARDADRASQIPMAAMTTYDMLPICNATFGDAPNA
jgi:hypothetical protein